MDGIIFDMDGTIWDTVDVVTKVWNHVISSRGIDKVITRDEMQSCMGMLMNKIMDRLIPMVDEADRESLRNEICQEEDEYLNRNGGKLYDGLEETLEYLSKKYELYIVSNCQDGYIQSFFRAHGLEKYFSDFECAGSTGLNKTENILLLAHRNGMSKYYYVGDTAMDMKSAKDAGAVFIYAGYGFGDVDESECDYVINELTELKDIFE